MWCEKGQTSLLILPNLQRTFMAKSMQVPVIVFEKQYEVELLMNAVHNFKEYQKDEKDKANLDALLHELYKINKIYEKTNNS
jgi:hypothetical protein